jgi:tetratricopeptide (TPR) repeat protein
MKTKPTLRTLALSLALAAATALPLVMTVTAPAAAAAKAPTISQDMFKPLKEGDELRQKENLPGALAKFQEALSKAKTPYDKYVANDYLGQVYVALNDYAKAAAAFDEALASGGMPAEAKASRMKITVQLFLGSNNYPKAIELGNRYLTEVGPDADVQAFVGQAQYQNKDLAASSESLKKAVALAAANKSAVKEEWLHYLEHAEADLKNINGVIAAEELLVQYFPKKENWASLLQNFSGTIKGSDKATLDLYRLMLAADAMRGSSDYLDMAKEANRQLLFGDARSALQKGFDNGTLSSGPLKAEATQLLAKATAAAASDEKELGATAKLTAGKPGEADVRFGEAFWSYGQYDQAIEAVERGIKKGGVKDPDDAQLRLGLAHLGAGHKDQALAAFTAANSGSPFAKISHMWALLAQHPPTP